MFTPDPCFNEPGYEGIKGTDEGDVSSILCKSSEGSSSCHTFAYNIWQLKISGRITHRYSKDMLTGIESSGSTHPMHSPVSCGKLVRLLNHVCH